MKNTRHKCRRYAELTGDKHDNSSYSQPRFTILRHDGPEGLHWDLLLESGGVLLAWALPQFPQPGIEMTAEALPDHRLLYLGYEGPITGDRGTVAAWDRGDSLDRQSRCAELVIELPAKSSPAEPHCRQCQGAGALAVLAGRAVS